MASLSRVAPAATRAARLQSAARNPGRYARNPGEVAGAPSGWVLAGVAELLAMSALA
jgi:hypothetical protein